MEDTCWLLLSTQFSHVISTLDVTLARIPFLNSSLCNQHRCSLSRRSSLATYPATFVTLGALRGMGCREVSSPATVPAAIGSVPEKLRKKKRNKKKQSKATTYNGNVVIDVPEVCCTPTIGFAYDVAPIGRLRNHRQHSRVARRTANLGHAVASPLAFPFNGTGFSANNVSNSRQYRRLLQLPEMIMFHNGSLSERRFNQSDQFGDWRLNLDPMLYEELLELSDRIGYAGAGLQEDEILACLSQTNKHSRRTSLSSLMSRNEELKCSICQEECKGNDDLGRLACGHYHHIDCIKQWLLQKNQCPLCKTAALVAK